MYILDAYTFPVIFPAFLPLSGIIFLLPEEFPLVFFFSADHLVMNYLNLYILLLFFKTIFAEYIKKQEILPL